MHRQESDQTLTREYPRRVNSERSLRGSQRFLLPNMSNSRRKELRYFAHDPLLLFKRELRIHRQRENLLSKPLCGRKIPRLDAISGVSLLKMQRHWRDFEPVFHLLLSP
jgi:hypothetical protein